MLPVSLVAIAIGLLLSVAPSHEGLADDTAAIRVIAHKSVPAEELSLDILRNIYGLRLRNWPDGTPITVVVLSDRHASHIAFCKQALKVFPYQLRWAWNRLIFAGLSQAPIQVSSETEMLETIAITPGAIGYVTKDWRHENTRDIEIH